MEIKCNIYIYIYIYNKIYKEIIKLHQQNVNIIFCTFCINLLKKKKRKKRQYRLLWESRFEKRRRTPFPFAKIYREGRIRIGIGIDLKEVRDPSPECATRKTAITFYRSDGGKRITYRVAVKDWETDEESLFPTAFSEYSCPDNAPPSPFVLTFSPIVNL